MGRSNQSSRSSGRMRLIIDGNNIAYRSDAVLNLSIDTFRVSAIYGMLMTLRHLLQKFQPEDIVVVWDNGRSSFRTSVYPEYKAHRDVDDAVIVEQKKMLFAQIKHLQGILKLLPVTQIEIPCTEADDIIAKMCISSATDKMSIIVSNDRDFIQLISNTTGIYFPTDRVLVEMRNIADIAKVKKDFAGLNARQMLHVKLMVGDSSDNITGIPGVGIKTALALVKAIPAATPTGKLISALQGIGEGNLNNRMRKILTEDSFLLLKRNRYLMDLVYRLVEKVPDVWKPDYTKTGAMSKDLLFKYFIKMKFASMVHTFDSWLEPFYALEKQNA